ncbi:MAG: biotin/lipoyl-binding protein [Woeseiaceae bacterium]|nr:biotin/lipoyl-binding protein [Woeseiaceae bacterium]
MAHSLNRSIAGLTALAAALLVAGCGVGEAKVDDGMDAVAEHTPLPVQSVAARFSDLYALYHATANVAADGEAQVPARIAGEVVETLVEEGDRVVQGQLLARIDAGRLEIRLRKTEAEFLQRQGEYQRQVSLHERGLVSSAAFESLKFEVAELKAAMELDRLNYRYSEVRAPIAGVIASRHIVAGRRA